MAAGPLRVIVTRPADQATTWVAQLRAAGWDACALPLICITPPEDPQPALQAWRTLSSYSAVVFVSPAAVQGFFALPDEGASHNWPAHCLACAPGPGTAQALISAGVPRSCIAEPNPDAAQFDSEALWSALAAHSQAQRWQGANVLIVAGGDADDNTAASTQRPRGRPWLAQQFSARGARVDHVMAYCRGAPQFDATSLNTLAQALAQADEHLWLFSSSDALSNLSAELARHGLKLNARAACLVTHPRIASAAKAAGFTVVRTCRPALADVVQALGAWRVSKP